MGERTGISWTDSTINCWHGCAKVSAGCRNCYAEVSTPVRVKRAAGLEVWGEGAARSETKGWEASLRKWQRTASVEPPLVHRVFGQSLSDTFENHRGRVLFADGSERRGDERGLVTLRARFFAAIERCPALTFQLLTKRPENVTRMVPPAWLTSWPANVWIGATVEDQPNADLRIPHLLKVPAAVRFLSVEPQVGPVVIEDVLSRYGCAARCHHNTDRAKLCGAGGVIEFPSISWVIQGGESGSKARPFDLAWARSLRDQCRVAGVPYFLKQLGAQPVADPRTVGTIGKVALTYYDRVRLSDSHGGDEAEWPVDLRGFRAFPEPASSR